jgi:signal transduction histidine kinase
MRPDGSTSSVSRVTLLAGLLGATVFLAGLLAYEAHDAARSERTTAEHALQDDASVAAWELRTAARKELDAAVARALGPLAGRVGVTPYEVLPPPATARAAASQELRCDDAGANGGRVYFRLDLRNGALATAPQEAAPRAEREVRRLALQFVRGIAKPEQPFGVLTAAPPDSMDLVALGTRYTLLGAPVAVYGFTTCRSALGALFFRDVLRDHPLLPSTAGSRIPNDSLFVVAVVRSDRDTVFSTGAPDPTPFAAEAALGWDGWRTQVTIRRAAIVQLLVRPPVRSRLALLLGLLVLTASLAAVAVLQIRREHELARLHADFISSVSHELRTPLAQILLFGETLSLGRARSEPEQRLAARTIVQEARRLIHMVESILSFSRQRRGDQALTIGPVALGPLIDTIVAQFAPLAAAAGVTLEVRTEAGVAVMADTGALRQVVLNLLDNAVKYGPAGQTVRVSADRHGDGARIAVEDQGRGIELSDRERIWSPYVRLRCATADGIGGSGLGLSVVRELAEAQGGQVAIEDRPGGGARFVVDLIRANGRAPGPPPESNVFAPLREQRHQIVADRSTALRPSRPGDGP